jgi:hypothetical protein
MKKYIVLQKIRHDLALIHEIESYSCRCFVETEEAGLTRPSGWEELVIRIRYKTKEQV